MSIENDVDLKGRITIPKEVRTIMNINPGDTMIFELLNGKLTLKKKLTPIEFVEASKKIRESLKKDRKEKIQFFSLFED